MSTITTRAGKGSPLTNTEVDNNFTNLNTDKLEDITGESIKDLSDVYSAMSPSDGQVLTFDTTNGWQAETPAPGGGLFNIVEDTTPQLGGNLDTNAFDINFGDGDQAVFNSNLAVYSSGSQSYIVESGSGALQIGGTQILIRNPSLTENYIRCVENAGVNLYYDNSIKLTTTSTGVQLGGDLDLNSNDITGTGNINITGNAVYQTALNAQTGTTYTTVIGDASKLVTLTNASAITVTIPPNSSVAYPVGTKIDFAQTGAGQVTFAGGSGVTVNATPTLKTRAQYSAASCIKTATDTWLLVGDLAES